MTTGYALTIKRLYGAGIVRVAAKHNLREIAAEIGADGHIDPARIANNIILRGATTAEGVAKSAKTMMDAAGAIKFRKTSVMALELLFTLPAATTINHRQYFEQATTWAEVHFGVPVLSAVVHLDEGAPHCHVLLLPLVNGRMGGSDLHGGKAKLWAMQTDFHDQVGALYGLVRQTPQKQHSAAVRGAAMELARDCLQANSALTDAVIDALLRPHVKDPAALLSVLGITMPASKAKNKSFAAIMTAPCKPEPRNPIGKETSTPIGKATFAVSEKSYPYTCVGIGFPAPPFPPPNEPTSASQAATVTSADLMTEPCNEVEQTQPQTSIVSQMAIVTTLQPHEPQPSSASTPDPAPTTAASTPASAADTEPPQADQTAADADDEPADQFIREHDSDHRTDQWDTDSGEWVAPKPAKTSHKAIAAASVRLALGSIGKVPRPPQRPQARRPMQC